MVERINIEQYSTNEQIKPYERKTNQNNMELKQLYDNLKKYHINNPNNKVASVIYSSFSQ